jgi:hypothetical protein
MDAASPAEAVVKPNTGFRAAAYDPDDDPYAMPEHEAMKPAPATGEEINQPVPQMEIEAKPAETEVKEGETKPEVSQDKSNAAETDLKDPLQTPAPDKEVTTPATTLPTPSLPQRAEIPPTPDAQQKSKSEKRGADPVASSSCRCYLM